MPELSYHELAWTLLLVLPPVSVAALVLGLRAGRTCPSEVLVAGVVAPSAIAAFVLVVVLGSNPWDATLLMVFCYMLVAATLLVLARAGSARKWKATRALMLVGLLMPVVPLVPAFLIRVTGGLPLD